MTTHKSIHTFNDFTLSGRGALDKDSIDGKIPLGGVADGPRKHHHLASYIFQLEIVDVNGKKRKKKKEQNRSIKRLGEILGAIYSVSSPIDN